MRTLSSKRLRVARSSGRLRAARLSGSGSNHIVHAALIAMAISAASNAAHADEPIAASEPRMMRETSEITSVVDAFDSDNDDPFDLNLTLGFEQRWKHANI